MTLARVLSILAFIPEYLTTMTVRELTNAASPLEKFEILADEIDKLHQKTSELEHRRSIDDLLEIVSLSDLAVVYGVPVAGLKKKLIQAGGEVFKIGKHRVIRKVKLVAVLENLERDSQGPPIQPPANYNN